MFCQICGKKLEDDATICMGCGCAVKNYPNSAAKTEQHAQQPYNQPMQNNMQQTYAQQNQYAPSVQKTPYAATILGIVGIVSAWLLAIIGHITSIIGIIVGIKECKETGKVTGLILSVVGEACSIISSLIGIAITSSMF